jgi:hypothetical protein
MSRVKRVLWPQRLRRVPTQFSWVDQQLVRGGFIDRCDPPAAALYLFLVTVADAQGLSYYSDAALCQHLQLTVEQLRQARDRLIAADLLAYQAPLYQVLALPAPAAASVPTAAATAPMCKDRDAVRAQLQRLREQLGSRRGRL